MIILTCFLSPVQAEQAESIGTFGTLNNTDNPLVLQNNKAQAALNVDISPGGLSVKKRKGYSLAYSLTTTTSPVHGVYNFFDSAGNSVDLYFNDHNLTASVGGATPTVLFSTGTFGATWQCTDSQGFAYCASSAREPIIKTNGVTAVPLGGAPAGTMITATPERLAISGISGYPNRIDFSAANNFSSWTPGGLATDPDQETISSPGSRITHITYACGELLWFKDASMGAIMGSDNYSFQIMTGNSAIGTLDNSSVIYPGGLQFRAQDGHIYSFDCSNLSKLTDEIQTTINAAANRRTNSWTQTTQSDFGDGLISQSGSLSLTQSPNSIVMSTQQVAYSTTVTLAADWNSGTLSNIDSTTIPGDLILNRTSTSIDQSFTNYTAIQSPPYPDPVRPRQAWYAQKFVTSSSSNQYITSVDIYCDYAGTYTYTVSIYNDSSGKPGSSIVSGSLPTTRCGLGATYLWASTTFTPTALSSYTPYWIVISSGGTVNNEIYWAVSKTAGPGVYHSSDGTTWDNTGYETYKATFKEYALPGYVSTGSYTSKVFDTGVATTTYVWGWNNFYKSATLNGQTINYFTKVSSSSTGPWDAVQPVTAGSKIQSNARQYLVFIASFSTTNPAVTPVLSSVSFNTSDMFSSSGTYYSAVHNVPNMTAWSTFGVGDQTDGGSITYYVRSASTSISIASSTPTWTAQTKNTMLAVSTMPYIQARADFTTTSATATLSLNDFTFNWFEGAASDKAYGIYYSKDNAIWWAVTSGAGVSVNNYVLRYDLLNSGWTLYDIPINGLLIRDASLYFGSSSSGRIYKFGDVDSDAGSAINSYWRSKDFSGGNPFVEKEYRNISLVTKSVPNSQATVTYAVDNSTGNAYNLSLYDSTAQITKRNRLLPAGKTGAYFSIMFGNNAADQPWELFGMSYTFNAKPWRTIP